VSGLWLVFGSDFPYVSPKRKLLVAEFGSAAGFRPSNEPCQASKTGKFTDGGIFGGLGLHPHLEQLEFIDIYAEQIQRWRTPGPSAVQTLELDRLETQNRRLRQVTTDVLALAHELRKGTMIDRIMAMSDLELGRQALREIPPPRRS
jgi:hypothetical protein